MFRCSQCSKVFSSTFKGNPEKAKCWHCRKPKSAHEHCNVPGCEAPGTEVVKHFGITNTLCEKHKKYIEEKFALVLDYPMLFRPENLFWVVDFEEFEAEAEAKAKKRRGKKY